jgi:long-chain acyl-CoA synthetase
MPTCYDGFRECAERWPGNVAVEIQRRDRVDSYTYAELRRMVESIGRWLVEQKLEPGARIALVADNHPNWVAAYLGIIAAGCTVVPLDTSYDAEQVAKLLKDSGSSRLFCDLKHLAVAREAVLDSATGIVTLDGPHAGGGAPITQAAKPPSAQTVQRQLSTQLETTLESILAAGPGDFRAASATDDEIACLLYTSGTTADPKGVMLSHGNIAGEAQAAFGWAHIGPSDGVLGVLPLFHVLAQMTNLVLVLLKGARVVYLETLNSTELLRALAERKITVLSVVPTFYYLIHERIFKQVAERGKLAQFAVRALMVMTRFTRKFGLNPGKIFFARIHNVLGGNIRYLLSAGSRFDRQIARDFQDLGFDVMQGYGLTETTGAAFATPPDKIVIGSVGPPLTGVQGKIIEPHFEEGIDQPIGEIAICGPLVMKGYWNRPDATAAVLKDGWLYTGDLGYFDAGGNLFITGRKKEVIILSNGKNVYPEEVEAHYLKSDYIKEICVMGLQARLGDPASERLHGVIVPDFDALKQRKIVNAKEVIRFDVEGLSVQLPSTQRIGSYEIWLEGLPRTTTRKIKRFEVERKVRANQNGETPDAEIRTDQPLSREDVAWLEQPEVKRAIAVIEKVSRNKVPSIRPDHNLELDLGLDSMQRIEMVVALEQELGGRAEESRLAEVYTVRQLIDLLRESPASVAPGAAPDPVAAWHKVLQEEPAAAGVLTLANSRRTREAFLYLLTRILAPIVHRLFQLRVSGLENLPRRGPFIIAPNHQSVIDAIIMSSTLPWPVFRDMFLVGTGEFFEISFMRVIARWLRIIVVDPDANLIPAMRAGAFGLKHGRVLILYPEGERSIDGKPKRFKKGAAILSIHTQVPIVPTAIEGFHDAWPRGSRFPRFVPLQIRFGAPISPPVESEASGPAYEQLTADLRGRVLEMWEELHSPAIPAARDNKS